MIHFLIYISQTFGQTYVNLNPMAYIHAERKLDQTRTIRLQSELFRKGLIVTNTSKMHLLTRTLRKMGWIIAGLRFTGILFDDFKIET